MVNGKEKTYYTKTNTNKAGVIMLIVYRVEFKVRKDIRDKDSHYMTVSILHEDITVIIGYIPKADY